MSLNQAELVNVLPASSYVDTNAPVAPEAHAAAAYGAPVSIQDDTLDFSKPVQAAAPVERASETPVFDELLRDPDLKFARAMFKAAGLQEAIERDAANGGVTLYAPTNEAFTKIPQDHLKLLNENSEEGQKARARLMGLHVSPANSGVQSLDAMSAAQFGASDSAAEPTAMTRGTYVNGGILTEQAPAPGGVHERTFQHDPADTRKIRAASNILRTVVKNGKSKFRIHSVDKVIAKQAPAAKDNNNSQ